MDGAGGVVHGRYLYDPSNRLPADADSGDGATAGLDHDSADRTVYVYCLLSSAASDSWAIDNWGRVVHSRLG